MNPWPPSTRWWFAEKFPNIFRYSNDLKQNGNNKRLNYIFMSFFWCFYGKIFLRSFAAGSCKNYLDRQIAVYVRTRTNWQMIKNALNASFRFNIDNFFSTPFTTSPLTRLPITPCHYHYTTNLENLSSVMTLISFY